jgi:hypothetical protein
MSTDYAHPDPQKIYRKVEKVEQVKEVLSLILFLLLFLP